eukprot:XP_001704685.1 Hypothetical protein GL50803_111923 [Giardia lamblia ATCC 50803]
MSRRSKEENRLTIQDFMGNFLEAISEKQLYSILTSRAVCTTTARNNDYVCPHPVGAEGGVR